MRNQRPVASKQCSSWSLEAVGGVDKHSSMIVGQAASIEVPSEVVPRTGYPQIAKALQPLHANC
jgi:hypothetical protein